MYTIINYSFSIYNRLTNLQVSEIQKLGNWTVPRCPKTGRAQISDLQCTIFISFWCASLAMFYIFFFQVKLYRRENAQLSLANQPWARCERLQEIVTNSQKNLRKFFPQVQRSMQLYLAHRETEFILFRPIRVRHNIQNTIDVRKLDLSGFETV